MRRNRITEKGATYYITATVTRDALELKNDLTKNMLFKLLKKAKTKFNFRLKHFSFMDGHIHLIIKPIGNKEMISKIMQWFLGTSAVIYNKTHGIRGKFWFDRFKSSIITSMKDFFKKFKNITNNPIRLEMMDSILNYKYTGIFYFLKKDYELIEPLPEFLNYIYLIN